MSEKIFYLGFFSPKEIEGEFRRDFPAADTKISYICDAMVRGGVEKVHVISAADSRKCGVCPGSVTNVDEHIVLKTFSSLGQKGKLRRILSHVFLKLQLFLYLLTGLSEQDVLVVYHSLYYIKIVEAVKRIRRFRLLIEVEEVYSDVTNETKKRKREYRFFQKADAFLFSAELLNQKINKDNKPYVIANGSYKIEPEYGLGFNDNRIHVMYAGTLDSRKGGAASAVEAAGYLDGKYHLHILGFGSEAEKSALERRIEEITAKTDCIVTYDGVKKGIDYLKFLQCCHIGLSTQNPDAAFNDTSFPSKILVYLANGLHVVSVRIPVVMCSAVSDMIHFYPKNTPEDIADAIKSVDIHAPNHHRAKLTELDRELVAWLRNVIAMIKEEKG